MKNKALHFGIFGAFLVIAALCVATLGYKAHAAAPSATTKTEHAYIIKTSAGFVYKQTAISLPSTRPFVFTNSTAKTQTVTSNGQTIVSILAHTSAPYSFAGAGTYTFGLASNPNAILTVTVS